MSVSYTVEQQRVIDTHGCNLLVSAAAGSGKTAVLVERIVKMISDEAHPVDIDRLLVVTFTNAAAAQMRERISAAIGEKLTKEPDNEHLQRQAALLHNAQITTIDSFCLFVIRNHFHTIGLDPGFRIADEGELKLLRNDVLGEVLEGCYQKEDDAFLYAMEYFSTGSRDNAVEEAVLKLYDFAMSNPFPEEWLNERRKDYAVTDRRAVSDDGEAESAALMGLGWIEELMGKISLTLENLLDQISHCIKLCEEPDGPYMYGELLEQEKEQLERLCAAKDYEECALLFSALSFGRLSSKKDDSVSAAKRELVKGIRTKVKERLQEIGKNYFAQSAAEVIRQMDVCREAVCALVDITLLFKETFDRTKREKNLLDFDDIEHFALSILLRRMADGKIEPTETALEYRDYFTEILIDEYQDSNLVQEYLLSAISGESEGRFNRFMVGDVKQSIYKFRLARPELFMEKYHMYADAGSGEGVDAADDGVSDVDVTGVDTARRSAVRIDLHQNFRSREEVLSSTNAVFSQVMSKQLGGIAYDEKAALYPGASYPEPAANDNDTEVLLFTNESIEQGVEKEQTQSEAEVSMRQQEAYGIAGKIKRLVAAFQITDAQTGQLRKASYKDIVILLRTTSGWDEEFKQVLESEGIPVHVTSKTGYFAAAEIQELLHFLRILDNPMQDIPLYGVLHSYFGGFSEEEIASVKAAFPGKRYLYDAVKAYAAGESMDDGTEAESSRVRLRWKLQSFLVSIDRYRDMAVYMPVHELLQTIIREYSYFSYVAAKPGGDRRRANVEMLLVRASDYEKISYYGLYHFLRYMEELEKYDVDYGEANLQDENADVVRIMSIHKSKGLEFPICFVAGLAKSFNMRDAAEHLVMDVERGIGVDYVDAGLRVTSRNLRRNYIALALRQDNLAEELRILYVAMTRAKEKLILTGAVKKAKKKMDSLTLLQGVYERVFSYDMLMQMNSFLDVIFYAAARNKGFDDIWRLYGIEPNSQNPFYGEDIRIKLSVLSWEDTLGEKIEETVRREDDRRKLLLLDAADGIDRVDKKLMTVMSEKFSYQYPYANLQDLYTKTTVSELKKAGMQEETDFSFPLYEEEQIVPYLPKFMRQEEDVSGTDRGSAFHKVMELLDFGILTDLDNKENRSMTLTESALQEEESPVQAKDRRKRLTEAVREELKRMLAEGKLPQAYYDVVSVPKIAAFLESGIARRMAAADAAGKLYREQPFVLGLPANRLNEAFPAQETVLIQGIIDVFFEENGSYIVVDYKTDAVQTPEELVMRYQTQLDYYAEALEQLSGYKQTGKGMRTAQKVIYSFKLEREISLR
ncbi:MAG: helicase-exonuclease AddAB subunit AddA [Bacillus sp. (in: Bacteria)]|nr:helicase-exonuclease AddAB subunit AddA [Bacillus sp. (in: firmicutes)]MCM1427167.1 helicase-exonuclease AddAB subunit AddA [Eubacterium sp.]